MEYGEGIEPWKFGGGRAPRGGSLGAGELAEVEVDGRSLVKRRDVFGKTQSGGQRALELGGQ
jgi:hypothetical protein